MDRQRFSEVTRIIGELQQYTPSVIDDRRRELYEEFFKWYPALPQFWEQYIQEEMKCRDSGWKERLTKLFYRSLPVVSSVRLFREYIEFVKMTSNDKTEICNAYDYAISRVGLDMSALPLYSEYASFAREAGIVQLNDLRTKIYHRAVVVPLDGIDNLWGSYQEFERMQNAELAKNILGEQNKKLTQTKQVYHNKKRYQKLLDYTVHPAGTDGNFTSFHLWRSFIEDFEKMETKLPGNQRDAFVTYTYKSALAVHRYSSLLWHEYAQFLIEIDNMRGALSVYREAVAVLPYNLFLHFVYAELLESGKQSAEAKTVYSDLITRLAADPSLSGDLTLAVIQNLKFIQRTAGPVAMRKEFIRRLDSRACTYHLILAVAEIEYNVNRNRNAALRILMLGVSLYESDACFLESVVEHLLKMDVKGQQSVADDPTDMAWNVINKAKEKIIEGDGRRLNRDEKEKDMEFRRGKVLHMLEQLHDHLLSKRDKEDMLAEVEKELVKMNPSEDIADMLDDARCFLPPDFRKTEGGWSTW